MPNDRLIPAVPMPVLPSAPSSVPESQYATRDYVMQWYSRLSARIEEIVVPGIVPATKTTLGGVIVGSGLTVDPNGMIDVVFPSHEGYLPLIQDKNGGLSAATVGERSTGDSSKVGVCSFSSGLNNIASGDHSHAEGVDVIAKGLNSHAEGCTTRAEGNCSHAEGKYTEASGAYSHAAGFRAKAQRIAYAWSGVESDEVYESHGDGTYNINPAKGIEGFYIGQKNLKKILSEEAPVPDLSGYVKKTAGGGVHLGPPRDDDPESFPLLLEIERAVRMGWRLNAGLEEAFLEMQVAGSPGGFKVQVTPGYDDSTGTETSRTTVSINDIPDVAAELRKISAKRDSADNIAAKDEVQFTEWKFHCDVPEIQAALGANPPEFQYDGGGVWDALIFTPLKAGDWWVTEILPCEGGEDTVALSFPITGYHDVNSDTLSSAVTATRKKVFTTKSGEPYVTPTGVKALAPKTELHALVPETSDTAITLKPVDGAANYVDGKVEGVKYTDPVRECQQVYFPMEFQNLDTGELVGAEVHLKKDDVTGYGTSIIGGHVGIIFVTSRDVSVYRSSDASILTTLPRGTFFELMYLEMDDPEAFINQSSIQWGPGIGEYAWVTYPEGAPIVEVDGERLQATNSLSFVDVQQTVSSTHKSPVVAIPTSTDTTKARKFTLAVETDAETEKAVEWQGGEVVEVVPGASKLVPGLNVWDVSEVAPRKFKVERASSPAQSVPLTLTASNGRVAELTVGDDLVLEVKEK